jgi:hypothetical protein
MLSVALVLSLESVSSAAARADSHAYTVASAGITGAGVRAGVYLPYDTSVEVESGVHSFVLSDTFYTATGVRARKFFGNSFYAAAGYDVGDGFGVRYVAIGNEWTLAHHLVIGGEWIGLGQVVFHEGFALPTARFAAMTIGGAF